MNENYKVHYDIYENALNYLNDLMTKSNKPRIKSINTEYKEGDLVLIKDASEYHVGLYNGVYLEIIRANVQVPKSDIEIELDRRREDDEKKLQDLNSSELTKKTDRDLYLEALSKRRLKYFEDFKKEYKIPADATMEQVFAAIEKSSDAFDDYVNVREIELENEALEYAGDYDEDDS